MPPKHIELCPLFNPCNSDELFAIDTCEAGLICDIDRATNHRICSKYRLLKKLLTVKVKKESKENEKRKS